MQCLIFKNQILLFPFRQRKGHKQNQGLQLKAQYDNSLALDTPLLPRKMVLYIVYFFTFWQLLYDFNKDCKQMFLFLTLFLSQAPSSLLLCCSLAFLHRAAKGLSWGKRRQCKPWACRKVQGRQGCQHLWPVAVVWYLPCSCVLQRQKAAVPVCSLPALLACYG